jgi:hypothetical protein
MQRRRMRRKDRRIRRKGDEGEGSVERGRREGREEMRRKYCRET